MTLEGKGDIAPFSITLGIYGLMFHTEFLSTLEQSQKFFDWYKAKIEMILDHYDVEEKNRDYSWETRQNEMMHEIVDYRG